MVLRLWDNFIFPKNEPIVDNGIGIKCINALALPDKEDEVPFAKNRAPTSMNKVSMIPEDSPDTRA